MTYLSPMDYTLEIKEELDFLLAAEKKQIQAQFRDYIRFLRLLKAHHRTTQSQAANQVNLSLRQAQRVWQLYHRSGLEALIRPRPSTYIGNEWETMERVEQ